MVKHFCDRCGKEIEDVVNISEVIFRHPIGNGSGNHIKSMDKDTMELCDSCSIGLRKYLFNNERISNVGKIPY